MFSSQCLLSRKGPLGAVLVAAYCFKRLKKVQVFETDISVSIDKIQDKFDLLTYRVLAYLLLGIVRIYSKKVDYLLDEFNEVIVKINEYVAKERHKVEAETLRAPYLSITLPESFALDAFDLEIIDDDDVVTNVTPQEKITLKDAAWETNTGLNSLEKNWYEEYDACINTLDYDPTGGGHSCHLLEDIEAIPRATGYPVKQEATVEKLRQGKPLGGGDQKADEFNVVYKQPPKDAISSGGDQVDELPMDVEGPQKLSEREAKKDKDSDRFSEECKNLQGENVLSEGTRIADVGQDHEVDEQPMDTAGSEGPSVRGANKKLGGDGVSGEYMSHFRVKAATEVIGSAEENHMRDAMEVEADTAGSEGPSVRGANKKLDGDGVSGECMSHFGVKAATEVIGSAEENHMRDAMEVEVDAVNLGTSVEKLMQDDTSRIQIFKPAQFCIPSPSTEEKDGPKEVKLPDKELPERICSPIGFYESSCFVTPSTEGNYGAQELKLSDTKASQNRVHETIRKGNTASVTTSTTPKSKPKTSAATPDFMFIRTPAPREYPPFSRKRKCLFDDVIVLPNHILKNWLDDSSDLVHKRRKGAHKALVARRMSQLSNLSQGLIEPLVPCGSEITALFLEKKLQIPKFSGHVEPMQKVIVPESLVVNETLEPKGAESHPFPACAESDQTVEPPGNAGMPEASSLGHSCLEPTEIAPQTPVRHSASSRPFGSPEYPTHNKLDGGMSSHLTGVESSWSANEELELCFLHEDINLCSHRRDEDSSEAAGGWSARTKVVADYLFRVFLRQGKEGEAGKVSLLQLLQGRTKKESARLFYEILVLKSRGFIDVSQTDAYGDISVWKVVHREQKEIGR